MEKRLKKIIAISAIFLLISIGLSPVATSKEKNKEQETSLLKIAHFENGNIKELLVNEENSDEILSLISILLESISSNQIDFEAIVDIIGQLKQNNNPILDSILDFIREKFSNKNKIISPFKKTFVISQGWNYNFNMYKASEFEMKRDSFSFWHYITGSRSGGESKTLIFRPDTLLFSSRTSLTVGRQTGFMIKPTGLFIHKSNMFPKPSFSFFIGFTTFAFANGEQNIELNLPLLT